VHAGQRADSTDKKSQEAREVLKKAEDSAQQELWDEAIRYYKQVLTLLPKHSTAQFKLAACYEASGDQKMAVDRYRATAKAKDAPKNLADDARLRVEELLTPALKPGDEEIHELVVALLKKAAADDAGDKTKLIEQALERLEKLQQSNPKYIQVPLEFGLAYELAGQPDKAASSFGHYLKLYAEFDVPLGDRQKDIRTRLALLKLGAGDKTNIQRANKLFADALAAEACGKHDDAIMILQGLLKDFPDFHQARYRLGLCYLAKSDTSSAVEQLTKVANAKGNSDAFVQEVCDLVEKTKLEDMTNTAGKTEQLKDAVAMLEAARELRARSYVITESGLTSVQPADKARFNEMYKRNQVLNRVVRDRITDARAGLGNVLRGNANLEAPLGAVMGEIDQLRLETVRGANGFNEDAADNALKEALQYYGMYLQYYKNLGLPDTAKTKEIRRRMAEVTGAWKEA
jgi:tetratricopeptide (TPR) repeat protein